ncbi:MAG: HEAT repeat domain-containing protein [Elusimicrobiales bacterium]|jgi:HEAT repeat protein
MTSIKKIIHNHLYSQNCCDREKAAEFLAKTDSANVATALAAELANKDRYIAIRAAWGLTLMNPEISLPPLIKALRNTNPDICKQAGWALHHIGNPKAGKALAAALKDPNPIVQREAASALRGKAIALTPEVQTSLVKLLERDKGAATITLGATKTKKAMNALAAALNARTFTSQAMAILALARAQDPRAMKPAVEMLKTKGNDTSTAMWALRLLNDTGALAPMVDYTSHLGEDEGFNKLNGGMETVDLLKRTAASEFLLPFLHNKNYRARLSGVVSLGAVASKKACRPLIEMLDDEHWFVRGSAAEALGRIADVQAVKPLIQSLRDKFWYVRCHAALALGKLKDHKAVRALLLAFKDKNESVRVAVAKALSEIADPKAVNTMIRGLADTNPYIRRASAEALGKMKAGMAVSALVKRLSNEQWPEIVIAIEALGHIGDRRAIAPLKRCLNHSFAEVYLAAEKALKQISNPKPTVFKHTYKGRIR